MNDKFTILVNSCDRYEDAWEPFFRLLKIHWPECENHRIILNTETKVYKCDFLKVETICGGKDNTWSKRLKYALNKIDSELVLCFLEDFFLQEKVNTAGLFEAVALMNKNKDIGYINLKYSEYRKWKKEPSKEEWFVSRDLINSNTRLAFVTALWRKQWLIDILRSHENPWEFEYYGSIRSQKGDVKALQIRNDDGYFEPVFCFDDKIERGLGITHGQWLPKNKELFEKYGIEVNFDNLGINYKLYEEAKNPPKVNDKTETQKVDLREILYVIKKMLKKLKKLSSKAIRKYKSLR